MRPIRKKVLFNRITIFIFISSLATLILIIRLFHLQVIKHNYYQDIATREQYGLIEFPAQRGEIIIKDHHSNEEFLLATNTTLNLIFADPFLLEDPQYVGKTLAPFLYDLEDEMAKDNERIEELKKSISPELTEEEIEELIKPLSKEELEKKFKEDLISKLSQKQRPEIQLTNLIEADISSKITQLSLPGIEIRNDIAYAHPNEISNKKSTAESLSPLIEIPSTKLEKILQGENRYIILKRKLDPDISDKIIEITNADPETFNGIGMQEEYFRFYPEKSLAANIIGYVNHDSVGQYGIESTFHSQLHGVAGKLQTKQDSIGRQITVGESILEPAIDGDNIVLTIDRSIQLKIEQILARDVQSYRADSGQVIVMNPKTGSIIAMAHYPSFNPNDYGEVFKKLEVDLTPEEIANLVPTKEEGIYYFYRNQVTADRYQIFEEKDESGNIFYTRYENFVGPEVYHNKIVSWPYEPGSVFKTIAMAIALDDGDITPKTTFNDEGPIGVDWNPYIEDYDYEIKNSHGYFGLVDMNTVLAESLNTGMTFIAKRIGEALFYNYLDKFGFLDRTDIEFDSEIVGKVEYFEDWSESELATHAFGQGITVTMIQLTNAYCAIANGGILMQPYIIEEIRHDDGNKTTTEPHEIRRVISEETAARMTAMLVHSTELGVANKAQISDHYLAGKTGTSQTYKHGRALSGAGTTITSFAGYGPINDPKFVILVKIDRPRASEWGSDTAAPTFSRISSYLMDYYNIPPDKTTTTSSE